MEALIKASADLSCKKLLVITWEYEDKEKTDGRTIKLHPSI